MTDLEKIELAVRQTADILKKIPFPDVIMAFETLASVICNGEAQRERARLMEDTKPR